MIFLILLLFTASNLPICCMFSCKSIKSTIIKKEELVMELKDFTEKEQE